MSKEGDGAAETLSDRKREIRLLVGGIPALGGDG